MKKTFHCLKLKFYLKKDDNLMKDLFKKSLMQICPPLLHLNMFNKPIWGQEALLEVS